MAQAEVVKWWEALEVPESVPSHATVVYNGIAPEPLTATLVITGLTFGELAAVDACKASNVSTMTEHGLHKVLVQLGEIQIP